MTLLVEISDTGLSPLDLAADVQESLLADAFPVVSVAPWAAPVSAPETAATQYEPFLY